MMSLAMPQPTEQVTALLDRLIQGLKAQTVGAAAVPLSVEEHEQLENDLEVLNLLVRGEQEIAAGVGYDLDKVLAEVDKIKEGQRK